MESCGEANRWEQVSTSRRTSAYCLPARGPVGGERTASSRLSRRFRHSRRLEAVLKVRKRKTGRARRIGLFLRIPKATLDILRAYGEDLCRAIFGLELDCGKLWRSKSLGAGVNQPEDQCLLSTSQRTRGR